MQNDTTPILHIRNSPFSPGSEGGFFDVGILFGFVLCAAGIFLAMFSYAAPADSTAGNASLLSVSDSAPAVSPELPAGTFLSMMNAFVPLSRPLSQGPRYPDSRRSVWPSSPAGGTKPQSADQTDSQGASPDTNQATSGIQGWGSLSSQIPPDDGRNTPVSVACVSASDCWAVGISAPSEVTLTEHWDGAGWTIVPSPNVPPSAPHIHIANYLNSVTCSSSSDCWAVGYSYESTLSSLKTLVQHWDGSSWSIVSSPNPLASPLAALQGVTCVSTSSCWAVGYYTDLTNGGYYQTLTEYWNGTTWSIVTSPNTSATEDNVLWGMTCTGTADCWAVGWSVSYDSSGAVSAVRSLVERWNGTLWAITGSPSSPGPQLLQAITCNSISDCWAVGDQGASLQSPAQTLVDRWDGSSWSVVPSPTTPNSHGEVFGGVTCTSAIDCWAVGWSFSGYYYDGDYQSIVSLIQHWDGSDWTRVISPNADPFNNFFLSIVCTSAQDCMTVGSVGSAGAPALMAKYPTDLPLAPLIYISSRKVHGNAGAFDLTLPLSGVPAVECRSGGPDGSYSIVFIFAETLTSVDGVTVNGNGSVRDAEISADEYQYRQYVVNLSGVTDAQTISVTLHNVVDWAGDVSPEVTVPMNVLVGDVNGSGLVDSGDVFLVRQQTGQQVTYSNFREDVNASGLIDSGDMFLTRQQTGTSLP